MSTIVKRTRYDSRDNIISDSRMNDHGRQNNTKKDIRYDQNGNIKSIKEVHEILGQDSNNRVEDVTNTDFEYVFFDDKWMVSKVTVNGKVQRETEFYRAYNCFNEDREYDSKSVVYNYDSNGNVVTITTFRSFELNQTTFDALKENGLISANSIDDLPYGFETVTTTITENKFTDEEHPKMTIEVKITLGSSETYGYYRYMESVTSDTEYGPFKVEEILLKDKSYSIITDRHFDEFHSGYEIKSLKNPIHTNREFEVVNEYIGYVNIKKFGDYYYRTCFEPNTDNSTTTEIVKEFSEDFGCDIITYTTMYNGKEVNRKVVIESTHDVIYESYLYSDPKTKEEKKCVRRDSKYTSEYGGIPVIEEISSEDEYGNRYKEKYLYDDLRRLKMTTVENNTNYGFTYHTIYVYNNEKDLCDMEISENQMIHHIYDDKDREIFAIYNDSYPFAKEVFDFYYNQVIQSL